MRSKTWNDQRVATRKLNSSSRNITAVARDMRNRQKRRRQFYRQSGDRRGQHESHAFRQSGVAPDSAIDARHDERRDPNRYDPRQAVQHLVHLRDAQIEVEAQQHRAKVRRRHQRHIEDELDESALVAKAQDYARDRRQVLDLAGRLAVERSIHQEQRHQREEQRHERNQQYGVVARHQAERDRTTARYNLDANQRCRGARTRHAEASQPMMRMVEAAA